uniref:DUF2345 domain-containing protein n=1 Tax=Pseudomonas viridiflava TaxID=33069 RepID=UPI000F034AC5
AVATLGIEALRQSLNQWPTPDSNGAGDPVLAVTAEAGIASATPRSQAHYAGENHDTTAQNHLQMTSGAAMHLQAGKGISAFAQDADGREGSRQLDDLLVLILGQVKAGQVS